MKTDLKRKYGVMAALCCVLLGGCSSGFIDGGNYSVVETEVVTGSRLLRLMYTFNRVVLTVMKSGANANLQYDGSVYYYKSATVGLVTTISCFIDSGAIESAGTVTVTQTSSTGVPPLVYTTALAISSGNRPMTGTLTTTFDPTTNAATTTGSVTVNGSHGAFPVTVTMITATDGSTTGTGSGTFSGETLTLSDVVASPPATSGAVSATAAASVSVQGGAPSLTSVLNADGSGETSLSDGTRFSWNSAGTGTVTSPGLNGSISIANVDNGI